MWVYDWMAGSLIGWLNDWLIICTECKQTIESEPHPGEVEKAGGGEGHWLVHGWGSCHWNTPPQRSVSSGVFCVKCEYTSMWHVPQPKICIILTHPTHMQTSHMQTSHTHAHPHTHVFAPQTHAHTHTCTPPHPSQGSMFVWVDRMWEGGRSTIVMLWWCVRTQTGWSSLSTTSRKNRLRF